ncbi:MAG: hypothetical protein JST06_06280 [Bacteroidetes bacterium]|nr:hypothetical protein [Bacteroidota bacterium]MBS1629223.1 hypothetical protein [Bacteroidota bacterium]
MTAYMFQLELPAMTDEIEAVIPQQRLRISALFSEGRLITYSLAQSQKMIWCVVMATDEQDAMELVASFPLHPFFTEVLCQALRFHNTVSSSLPDISLN